MTTSYPLPNDDVLALHASLKGLSQGRIYDRMTALGWEEVEAPSCSVYISPDKQWAIKCEDSSVPTYHVFARLLLNFREEIFTQTDMLPRVFGFEYGEKDIVFGDSPAIVLMEALETAPEEEVMEFEFGVRFGLKDAVYLIRENYKSRVDDFEQKLSELCQNNTKLIAAALVIGQASLVAGAKPCIGDGDIMKRGDSFVFVDVLGHSRELGSEIKESEATIAF